MIQFFSYYRAGRWTPSAQLALSLPGIQMHVSSSMGSTKLRSFSIPPVLDQISRYELMFLPPGGSQGYFWKPVYIPSKAFPVQCAGWHMFFTPQLSTHLLLHISVCEEVSLTNWCHIQLLNTANSSENLSLVWKYLSASDLMHVFPNSISHITRFPPEGVTSFQLSGAIIHRLWEFLPAAPLTGKEKLFFNWKTASCCLGELVNRYNQKQDFPKRG